jgi:hypothetical protein
MDRAFLDAMKADWQGNELDRDGLIATLISQCALWRGRANYWRGKGEAQAETIACLRACVAAAGCEAEPGPEPIDDGPDVSPLSSKEG